MTRFSCPTCRKEFDSAASRSLPFCSPRCRQIDLGRWLSEENRLPLDPEEADEEPADIFPVGDDE